MFPSLNQFFLFLWIALALAWIPALVIVILARRGITRRHRRRRELATSACRLSLAASVFLFFGAGSGYAPILPWATGNLMCALCCTIGIREHSVRARRRASHLCPACDYDLRGLPEDITGCPECGEPIDEKTRPRPDPQTGAPAAQADSRDLKP